MLYSYTEYFNMFIISVEGNIGSGKSTFLDMLKMKYANNQDIVFLDEPLDAWSKITDENGTTMLEKFYNDKEKHSFAFQMMAYISRLQRLQESFETAKKENYDLLICERSLHTDKNVFCKMLYDEGKIDEFGYQIYNKWFDHFQSFIKKIGRAHV